MNTFKYILKKLWIELLYSIISLIYISFLNNYNHILLSKYSNNNYLEILFYDGGSTIAYFVIAVILSAIGSMMAVKRIRRLFYEEIENKEIYLMIGKIILIIFMVISIIIFINNPILRAVIFGGIMLIVITYK